MGSPVASQREEKKSYFLIVNNKFSEGYHTNWAGSESTLDYSKASHCLSSTELFQISTKHFYQHNSVDLQIKAAK